MNSFEKAVRAHEWDGTCYCLSDYNCGKPSCIACHEHQHVLHAKYFGDSQPFYWTKVHDDPKVSAPSGWYQWTKFGLIYLGETLLETEGPEKP